MWKMLPACPPQAATTRRGSRFWTCSATERLNACHAIYTALALERICSAFIYFQIFVLTKKKTLRLLDSPCKRTQSVHFYYIVTSVIHFYRPQLFIYLSKKAACLCASDSIVDHMDERILDALRFSFVPERHEHTHRKVASIKDERKIHVAVKRMKK